MSTLQTLSIDGPAGALAAQLKTAPRGRPIAVLCHPHPLYGGSMHDAVLGVAADCAHNLGMSSFAFNFRGVGASGGKHQPTAGVPDEVDDLCAVLNWVTTQQLSQDVIAIGYSFGASVVSHCVSRTAPDSRIDRAVLIAPPNAVMSCQTDVASQLTDVIYGDQDDYVDPTAYQQVPHVAVHKLTNCDHFFSAAHDSLAHTLSNILNSL